jgi:hypothetical protein
MARRQPDNPLKDATAFCKHHLGRDCFAPFTGQDYSAWKAFVYLVELYGRGDMNGQAAALEAMAATLCGAQNLEHIHQIFVQTIPAILDWGDAAKIWPKIQSNWFVQPIGGPAARRTLAETRADVDDTNRLAAYLELGLGQRGRQ